VIVVDTSALIAIFQGEPDAETFLDAIIKTETALIAAPTRLEAFIVARRRYGAVRAAELTDLIAALNLTTVAFDGALADVAQMAYRTFGQGAHGLNYGDCFSYALAKSRDLPLLFKGEDFAVTDVRRAA
jgi:ribonuclease VapC